MDYILCGWRVRSEIELPELPPIAEDGKPADITIAFGEAVDDLIDPVRATPFLRIARNGTAMLTIEDVARYRIEGGSRVTIAPKPGTAPAEVRLFLLGTVLGTLCHQRGAFPMHASAVAIGGRAIAFAGRSGIGKSTLAASLVKRGHTLLSDDVCRIDVSAEQSAILWPSHQRMKLWEDSVAELGLKPDEIVRNREEQNKFQLRIQSGQSDGKAVPLAKILVLLTMQPKQSNHIEWLQGFDAFGSLMRQVYRRRAGIALGRGASLYQTTARLAGAVPIGQFSRPSDFSALDAQIKLIESLMDAGP